jgi:hypothetical protein
MEILVLGLVLALIGATWLLLALVDSLERAR